MKSNESNLNVLFDRSNQVLVLNFVGKVNFDSPKKIEDLQCIFKRQYIRDNKFGTNYNQAIALNFVDKVSTALRQNIDDFPRIFFPQHIQNEKFCTEDN